LARCSGVPIWDGKTRSGERFLQNEGGKKKHHSKKVPSRAQRSKKKGAKRNAVEEKRTSKDSGTFPPEIGGSTGSLTRSEGTFVSRKSEEGKVNHVLAGVRREAHFFGWLTQVLMEDRTEKSRRRGKISMDEGTLVGQATSGEVHRGGGGRTEPQRKEPEAKSKKTLSFKHSLTKTMDFLLCRPLGPFLLTFSGGNMFVGDSS